MRGTFLVVIAMYYRLLAMPYLPIFVFDGPKRPKIKRGKAITGKEHWMVNSLRKVLDAFGFECRTAPGEAEAELAYLNRIGVIDAILSDDVDCFLFGARTVIRNSSATLSGSRAVSTRTDGKDDGQHVYMYQLPDIQSHPNVSLTPGGLILIALLRGGDYDQVRLTHSHTHLHIRSPTSTPLQQGIDGCGIVTAHALARAGLGDTLLTAALTSPFELQSILPTWRKAVRTEISTNASGHGHRKSPALAKRITDSFPNLDVLRCYTHPITSESDTTRGVKGSKSGLETLWQKTPDISKIAHVCELFFEWGVEETVVKRFRSFLWPGAVLRQLLQAALERDARRASKHTPPTPETPSKTLARTLHRLELDSSAPPSSDTDAGSHSDTGSHSETNLSQLIVGIRSERRHTSTDHTLEYRLEINPSTLVAHARAGIQGLRKEMKDSAGGGWVGGGDDDGDGDSDWFGEGEGGGEDEEREDDGTHKTTSVDPECMLRIWIPAVVVQQACPELVRAYVERKEEKAAKKAGKGKAHVPVKKLPQKPFKFALPHKSSTSTSKSTSTSTSTSTAPPPRSSSTHASPPISSTQSSRAASPTPSPHKPSISPTKKPLHLAMARTIPSNTHEHNNDDDTIIISSDSDDALRVSRMTTGATKLKTHRDTGLPLPCKPAPCDTGLPLPRKSAPPRDVDKDWEVIDLT